MNGPTSRSLREGWAIRVGDPSPATIYLTEYPRASIQAENPCLNLFICWLYAAWAWLDCCCTCAPAAWDACCLDCSLALRCCRPPRTVPTVAPTAAPVPASPTIPPTTAPPTAPFAAPFARPPLACGALAAACSWAACTSAADAPAGGRSLRIYSRLLLNRAVAVILIPDLQVLASDCFWGTQTSRASAPQKTEAAAPWGPPGQQPFQQPEQRPGQPAHQPGLQQAPGWQPVRPRPNQISCRLSPAAESTKAIVPEVLSASSVPPWYFSYCVLPVTGRKTTRSA